MLLGMDWLYDEWRGNPVWHYLLAAGIVLVAMLLGLILRTVFRRWSGHQDKSGHVILASGLKAVAESMIFLCFAIAQNLALDLVDFSESLEKFQEVSSDLITLLAFARLAWPTDSRAGGLAGGDVPQGRDLSQLHDLAHGA